MLSSSVADNTVIDPAVEQARLKALTGGGAVVIQRQPARRGIKLPGL